MRQCFPSPSSPSDAVRQAWGIRSPGTRDLLPGFLTGQGNSFRKLKLSGEREPTWFLAKLHGALSPFPIPSRCSCSCCSDASTADLDKPLLLSHDPFHVAAATERYCMVPSVPLHGPHTAPSVDKTHIADVCHLCRRRCECLCLPLALWRLPRGFLLFQRLHEVLSAFLLQDES